MGVQDLMGHKDRRFTDSLFKFTFNFICPQSAIAFAAKSMTEKATKKHDITNA